MNFLVKLALSVLILSFLSGCRGGSNTTSNDNDDVSDSSSAHCKNNICYTVNLYEFGELVESIQVDAGRTYTLPKRDSVRAPFYGWNSSVLGDNMNGIVSINKDTNFTANWDLTLKIVKTADDLNNTRKKSIR
jgi:hypothetical protein